MSSGGLEDPTTGRALGLAYSADITTATTRSAWSALAIQPLTSGVALTTNLTIVVASGLKNRNEISGWVALGASGVFSANNPTITLSLQRGGSSITPVPVAMTFFPPTTNITSSSVLVPFSFVDTTASSSSITYTIGLSATFAGGAIATLPTASFAYVASS